MKSILKTMIGQNHVPPGYSGTASRWIWMAPYLIMILIMSGLGSLMQVKGYSGGTISIPVAHSKVTISGTSSIRDWVVVTNAISVAKWNGSFEMLFSQNPEDITDFNGIFAGSEFRLPVERFDSGVRIMNQTMMEHLNSENHPEISYTISHIREVVILEGNEECFQMAVTGSVEAAGVAYEMDHDVTLCMHQPSVSEEAERAKIRVFGEFEVLMTSFEIDPPTFMGGSLKTGDLVKVAFEIVL